MGRRGRGRRGEEETRELDERSFEEEVDQETQEAAVQDDAAGSQEEGVVMVVDGSTDGEDVEVEEEEVCHVDAEAEATESLEDASREGTVQAVLASRVTEHAGSNGGGDEGPEGGCVHQLLCSRHVAPGPRVGPRKGTEVREEEVAGREDSPSWPEVQLLA